MVCKCTILVSSPEHDYRVKVWGLGPNTIEWIFSVTSHLIFSPRTIGNRAANVLAPHKLDTIIYPQHEVRALYIARISLNLFYAPWRRDGFIVSVSQFRSEDQWLEATIVSWGLHHALLFSLTKSLKGGASLYWGIFAQVMTMVKK